MREMFLFSLTDICIFRSQYALVEHVKVKFNVFSMCASSTVNQHLDIVLEQILYLYLCMCFFFVPSIHRDNAKKNNLSHIPWPYLSLADQMQWNLRLNHIFFFRSEQAETTTTTENKTTSLYTISRSNKHRVCWIWTVYTLYHILSYLSLSPSLINVNGNETKNYSMHLITLHFFRFWSCVIFFRLLLRRLRYENTRWVHLTFFFSLILRIRTRITCAPPLRSKEPSFYTKNIKTQSMKRMHTEYVWREREREGEREDKVD